MSFSTAPNSAVVMNTSLGEIAIQLYNDMPITTQNFIQYVTSGEYNGTIFHRVATQSNQQIGVVQGGGFTNQSGTLTPIATNPPIANEWTASHPNDAGTIAMARTSELNSATSQFFFNVTDNPTLDNVSGGNQYADFGNVIRGMGIINIINGLSATNTVTASDGEQLQPPEINGGYVTVNTASVEDTMTVTIGTHDAAHDRSVTFTDKNGTTSKVNLAGGDATIQFTGTSMTATRRGSNLRIRGTDVEMQQITVDNSTDKSNLNFSASGGSKYVTVGDITVNGPIKSINGPNVNLTGDLSTTGGIKTLKFLAATNAGNISIGSTGGATKANVSILFMQDIGFNSNIAIRNFTSRQDVVEDGTNRGIGAPSIDNLQIFGELDAAVNTTAQIGRATVGTLRAFLDADTIRTVSIGQISNGGVFSSNSTAGTVGIKNINVAGAITNGIILAQENIGAIRAKSMSGSTIAAGTNSSDFSTGSFPTAFSDNNAKIGSISLKRGSIKSPSFSDTQVAAPNLGEMHLGRIATKLNSATTLGLEANSIKSLVAVTDKKQSVNLKNLSDPTKLAAVILADKLNFGSFQIKLQPFATT